MILRHCLLVVALAALAAPALASDWTDFPEFRHVSGLPGNGFGVDPNGQVGFGGAFHMNVPCAYTPARDNYAMGYYSASADSSLRFGFGGKDVDGTGFVAAGLGQPGRGICVSETFTEKHLRVNCFNLQWEFQPETEQSPALAVGVLDIQNRRPRVLDGMHGARSFYVVASRRLVVDDKLLYGSVGIGDGRFHSRPFAGLSWYPAQRINLGLEYDGWVLRPHAAYNLAGRGGLDATAALAWSDFDRPVLGLAITYRR